MNNYLNNTLTNLHLQDFLKEKGLDVSHMRYISDRQLAVDNLHMVPNMKDYLKSGYFILDIVDGLIFSQSQKEQFSCSRPFVILLETQKRKEKL